MTRRHDERWAIPTGNDEHVLRLEEEVLRLNQVQRTLEANIDFLRGERDRLMVAGEAARVEIEELREELAWERSRVKDAVSEIGRLSTAIGQEEAFEVSIDLVKAARQIERLREENRSLVQTVRRVLRGTPA